MQIGFGVESSSFVGFYKMTIKNQTTPVFQKLEKGGDGKWTPVAEASSIAGYLNDVKIEKYEYKKEDVQQLVLILDLGDGGLSKLEMNLNGISKGILNNLANEDVFIGKKLAMRLYVKNDNPNVYCTLDDQKMSWALKVEDVKKHWKDDDFWVKLFDKKIQPKLDKIIDTNVGFGKDSKKEVVPDPIEDDDLPF